MDKEQEVAHSIVPFGVGPLVVYPFFLPKGSKAELSAFDLEFWELSVLATQLSCYNATLVTDASTFKALQGGAANSLTRLFSDVILVDEPREAGQPASYGVQSFRFRGLDFPPRIWAVFASTLAKAIGLQAMLPIAKRENRPILLLDHDALIWPQGVQDLNPLFSSRENYSLVTGYFEPKTWEAYTEAPFRLASIIETVLGVSSSEFELLSKIPNAGVLHFNNLVLVEEYIELLLRFVTEFHNGDFIPRRYGSCSSQTWPVAKEYAESPATLTNVFSECMVADQFCLGLLLQQGGYKATQLGGFDPRDEYPVPSNRVVHLWKLKRQWPSADFFCLWRQTLLRLFYDQFCMKTAALANLGYAVLETPLPLLRDHSNSGVFRQLIRFGR